MTILILGEHEDDSVAFCTQGLTERGLSVEVVTASDLRTGSMLFYRVDSGTTQSLLQPPSRAHIRGDDVQLVINRLHLGFHGGDAHERYVDEEWRAALVAWLRTFRCPVLNPPRGSNVSGLFMNDSLWRVAASRAGLPTPAWPGEPRPAEVVVLALGDTALDGEGPVASELTTALIGLTKTLGLEMLEAHFAITSDRWEAQQFNVWPDLSAYGAPCLDAIMQIATNRNREAAQ